MSKGVATEKAAVRAREEQPTGLETLLEAVKKAGYSARVVRR